MSNYSAANTDELVTRAAGGDQSAVNQLMDLHRARLRRMVAVRLSPRIAQRIDPSDIVQEAMTEAAERLKEYADAPAVAFYPWLRRIAWQRLQKAHRFHLATGRRTVEREDRMDAQLTDESLIDLAKQLAGRMSTPSEHAMLRELKQRVQEALDALAPNDREVLVLRYLEQLPLREVAEVVEASVEAVKKRHARALHRLQAHLSSHTSEDWSSHGRT